MYFYILPNSGNVSEVVHLNSIGMGYDTSCIGSSGPPWWNIPTPGLTTDTGSVEGLLNVYGTVID